MPPGKLSMMVWSLDVRSLSRRLFCSSRALSFCRSVMSSCVTTWPPFAVLRRRTLMMRPSASSWMPEDVLLNSSTSSSTKCSGPASIVAAARHAILEQLAERGSRFYLLAGEAVHLGIALVADHQLLLAIEHGQPLRHVVQGRVELLVLLLQSLLEPLALGDVLVRRHPAAAPHGLPADGDVAAVAQSLDRHRSLVEGSQSFLDIVFRAGSCVQTVGDPGFDDTCAAWCRASPDRVSGRKSRQTGSWRSQRAARHRTGTSPATCS